MTYTQNPMNKKAKDLVIDILIEDIEASGCTVSTFTNNGQPIIDEYWGGIAAHSSEFDGTVMWGTPRTNARYSSKLNNFVLKN